jgi:hypothetical protein
MHFVPRLVAGFLVTSLGIGSGMALASAPMVGKAKSAGMPVKNCQYCHTEALPKKETFKPDELNERGKWLLADMKTRNLKEPDIAKLKDYPGGKEQK